MKNNLPCPWTRHHEDNADFNCVICKGTKRIRLVELIPSKEYGHAKPDGRVVKDEDMLKLGWADGWRISFIEEWTPSAIATAALGRCLTVHGNEIRPAVAARV
jgi:hypothetical protein